MKTWGTMKTEIISECNIEGEDFISSTELLTWGNEGKDEAEAEIVGLYDKYLETEGYLALTINVKLFNLPTDIYANKITGLFYNNGSEKYEITLIKNKKDIYNISENDNYRYTIVNSTAGGIQLKLHPASRETASQNVVIHYIRESQALASDASLMDIPLADSFIKQYVKDKIKEKEIGPMNLQSESPMMAKERRLLLEALSHMIPSDSADEIHMDAGFYCEFGDPDNGGNY